MAMACFAAAGLSLSVVVKSRKVHVAAPRVSLRKLNNPAAGRGTLWAALPTLDAVGTDLWYSHQRSIESCGWAGGRAIAERRRAIFSKLLPIFDSLETYPFYCIGKDCRTGYRWVPLFSDARQGESSDND